MKAQRTRATVDDALQPLDRPLLFVAGILIALGVIFAMAASPGAAARLEMAEPFHFALRHALLAVLGAVVLLAAANLPPIAVRRVCAVAALAALALVAVAAIAAPEIKGASRWVDLGFVTMQPSEVLKPCMVVVFAWMLSEHMRREIFPGHWIASVLFALTMLLLLAQPDIGQAALLGVAFAVMLLLAGVSWRWLAAWGAIAAFTGLLAYRFIAYARARVDTFLDPEQSGYQAVRALDAIAGGGVLGRGPGEGVVKRTLPDAHSDFIYAVAAEEFGLLASVGLLLLFAYFVWRGLSRASRLIDPFAQLAAAGLITLIGAQAAIHFAVNLGLIPVKGMTLPLVSYGGSSMVGVCLTIGLALALMRDRPGAYLYETAIGRRQSVVRSEL
jgi:cell division protein FtsW